MPFPTRKLHRIGSRRRLDVPDFSQIKFTFRRLKSLLVRDFAIFQVNDKQGVIVYQDLSFLNILTDYAKKGSAPLNFF